MILTIHICTYLALQLITLLSKENFHFWRVRCEPDSVHQLRRNDGIEDQRHQPERKNNLIMPKSNIVIKHKERFRLENIEGKKAII